MRPLPAKTSSSASHCRRSVPRQTGAEGSGIGSIEVITQEFLQAGEVEYLLGAREEAEEGPRVDKFAGRGKGAASLLWHKLQEGWV